MQRDRADLTREAAHRLCNTRAHLLNLTQQDFAQRFGISYGQAIGIECARALPSLATRTLIEAIRLDPDLIAKAAVNARRLYER